MTDANGRPLYRQGVVHDITGRKRAEEVLRETTGRHSSVLENMSEGLMIFDADRNLIFQNPAAARIHGYRVKQDGRIAAEELASTWEGWDEEGHPVAFDEWPLSRVTRGQCFQDMVLHVRRAETGHEFWASYNGCPIYDRDGRILHGFITITDITERYRVEKELRRKEEEARLLLRGAPAAICEIDLRGPRFASVNDWICEQTGYSREELVEMTPYALLDEESQARFRQRMQLALAGGSPEEAIEYTAITKDGRKISAELNISVIYEGGKPTRALVVGHDVTQRKRVERELEEGRKKYQTLIELNADFVWEMDAQGRYTYCSPQMEQLWGLKPDDMIGRTPFEFLPQAEREAADRLLAELVQGDAPFSGWESASHDGLGNLVFLELRGVPIHDESGTVSGLRGTTRDVTERKLAEEALRKSEERFRLMFERHGAVMLLIDPATGAIVDGNAAATRFYGCSRDELCALSIHDLNQLPPEQVAAEYRKAAAEERSHFVFPHAVAGGETRWVDVHSVPIEVQGENLLFSIIQDITERKRAEEDLQRSEEQQSFLLDLSDTVRSLEDPMELQAVAARALGERLAVDRVFYADVIAEDDGYYLVIERGYHAPGLSDVHGRIPMSLYSDRDNREYRAGRTVWSSDVDADPKVTASERRAYQANKTRSYVGVPIIKQRRLVAVLGIVHGAPREWRPGEITFAERAADRIWRELERARAESGLRESEERYRQLAADNERLYRQQLDIAETLQGALLDIPSELGSVHIGHLYRSATEQARVGGDFYDVFQAKEGRIALLIGDVSGHGLEAARVATLVKDIVHAFAHQFRRPQLVLREANRLLVEKNLPGFVTAFLGFLDPDTGTLVYSSAGHPPPLLLADGQAEPLTSASLPLGVFGDARYHDLEIDVPKGARLLLYTDGLTEARRNGDFFGETRLAEALVRERATRIEELPSLLLDEALHFSGGTLVDDVALLAVSFPGGMGGEER